MQLIGRSKVTKLNAKAGIVYPLIRLPKFYASEIGKIAEIFEIKHDNKRALIITFDEQAETGSEVIQLTPKVIQPDCQNDLEARLCELESQIAELKSLLHTIENQKAPQSPFFRQSTQKPNGLGRIRTGDLRRVKTEVLGGFDVFSVGDTTARKANDPLLIV
jgi:hypothetical protein